MKQYTEREFVKILRKNGYVLVRSNGGHNIYENKLTSKHITITANEISAVICRRLIKEYNLMEA